MEKDKEIEVRILEVSRDNRRISLGLKQTEDDPWPELSKIFESGKEIEGEIVRILDKGIILSLEHNVEGIVPEFLALLKGVIDSPDIPLNVSRSYLQSDSSVKKITNYITRKVADKLNSIFKNDRKSLEEKWNDIKVVIEYGMLTEDKFYDKAEEFNLYPTVDEKYLTYPELEKKIKKSQTDKDGNLIILYLSLIHI